REELSRARSPRDPEQAVGLQTQWTTSGRPESQERALHLALTGLNRERLSPGTPREDWAATLFDRADLALKEGRFLEEERHGVKTAAAAAPDGVDAFAEWFDSLREVGPGQFDPLFDFLAERA